MVLPTAAEEIRYLDDAHSPAVSVRAPNHATPTLLFGRIAPRGRVRAVGHPGAPPPAPGGRKRRKQHRSKEGHKPQTTTSPEKARLNSRARVSRKRRERQPIRVAGVRGTASRNSSSGSGHGGYGSDDSDHAVNRTVVLPEEVCRPPYPVHPTSASCATTSSTSPGSNRPEMAGSRARGDVVSTDLRSICRAEGDDAAQKEDANQTHGGGDCVKSSGVIGGAHNQLDPEEGEQPSHRSSVESSEKRRASLLRVRRWQHGIVTTSLRDERVPMYIVYVNRSWIAA